MGVDEEREYAWATAQEAWLEGKLPEAYHYCHAALARGHDPAAVYALMATIAILFGRNDQARTYLAQAIEHEPPRVADPRYLIIQPWGCGFWGEVHHAVAQFAFAEVEGRIPIMWWGRGCLYHAPGFENAWDAYFQPINGHLLSSLEKLSVSYAPAKWNAGNLRSTSASRDVEASNRVSSLLLLGDDADVVVADCFTRIQEVLPWAPPGHWLRDMPVEAAIRELLRRYVRPTDEIANEVEGLATTLFTRRPILAVHVRAQSRMKVSESAEKQELGISDYLPLVDDFVARYPAGGIYLLTDLVAAVATFAQRYPGAVLVLPAARLDRPEDRDVATLLDNDPAALAREVMRDVYLAIRCDEFIGDGASTVSCFIGHLKNWPVGTFRLLREDVTLIEGLAKIEPR